MWLAPNHQLLDLEPIEKDDLLCIGCKEILLAVHEKKFK